MPPKLAQTLFNGIKRDVSSKFKTIPLQTPSSSFHIKHFHLEAPAGGAGGDSDGDSVLRVFSSRIDEEYVFIYLF